MRKLSKVSGGRGPKSSRSTLALALVTIAGLLALSASGTAAAAQPATVTQDPPSRDPSRDQLLTAELQHQTGGDTRLGVKAETGVVNFIGGAPGRPLAAAGPDVAIAARSFVDRYAPLMGIDDPAGDLVESRRTTGEGGQSAVRYQQRHQGVAVVAGGVSVQVAADGTVLSAAADVAPKISVDTTPTFDRAEAQRTALKLTLRNERIGGADTAVTNPQLMVYDPLVIGANGPPGARLVWQVGVRTADGSTDEYVLIDAQTGAIALNFNQRADAKDRSVCDNANSRVASSTCTTPVRIEGGPATGLVDVDNAYLYSGVTWDFFKNVLNRDSVDNLGLPLKSTVRFCQPTGTCPYANAFWTGQQMVYGAGFANADDVVGHELTHGVTQYTSGLMYYSESGAINESMSDVFGELIDLSSTAGGGNDSPAVRWLLGEDLPGGAIRNMANPPAFNDPDKMTSPLYYGGTGDQRGVHTNSGVNNKATFLITDGGSFNGRTVTGLGITKAAHIYYTAESTMISPGTNYAELYNMLQQSCTNLVGQFGITAPDCVQVSNAVDAVEMNLAPTAPGGRAAVPAVCPTAQPTATDLFNDNMENPASGNWTFTDNGGVVWSYSTRYPRSPTRSLFAPDSDVVSDINARTTTAMAVPVGQTTFLRFNHAWMLDFDNAGNYDGGVVEYSTNGGGAWSDAGPLMTDNGYNGVLRTGFSNPIEGRSAFVNDSPGYQTTRIDLSSLGGQNVMVRFRLGSDSSFKYTGWFIDDVRAYTCSGTAVSGSKYHPVIPSRILDSRTLLGGWGSPLVAGSDPELQITGLPGPSTVPSTATAVIMNVTATNASTGSFVTVWPSGLARPTASNLNFAAGETIPNLVTVKIGTLGRVTFGNAVGSVHMIADVVGYFDDGVGPGDLFTGVTPTRFLDSRNPSPPGPAGWGTPLPAGTTRDLTVRTGIVPSTATAVVANVTATGASTGSFLSVWPSGVTQPNVSNLNFAGGQTIPNLVTVRIGSNGKISFANAVGSVDVIVDIVGYFDPTSGARFHAIDPTRMLDSRTGVGLSGFFTSGVARPLPVAGSPTSGVRADATAVIANVTVTEGTDNSFMTVYPDGVVTPMSSNLNFAAGQTIPNLVMVKIGTNGNVAFLNQLGSVKVIADAVGYYATT